MTGMIALSLTPAFCAIAAMILAFQEKSYGAFLWTALVIAFFIASTVSGITP